MFCCDRSSFLRRCVLCTYYLVQSYSYSVRVHVTAYKQRAYSMDSWCLAGLNASGENNNLSRLSRRWGGERWSCD